MMGECVAKQTSRAVSGLSGSIAVPTGPPAPALPLIKREKGKACAKGSRDTNLQASGYVHRLQHWAQIVELGTEVDREIVAEHLASFSITIFEPSKVIQLIPDGGLVHRTAVVGLGIVAEGRRILRPLRWALQCK